MKAQLKYVSTRKSYAGKVLKYCHNDNYIPEKFALEKRCRTHKLENHQLTNDFFTFFCLKDIPLSVLLPHIYCPR